MDVRLSLALVLFVFAATPARAQFHDQGMVRVPAVKTDYADPVIGTENSPLVIGTCLWNNCATERTVFPRSNFWQQNLPCDPCTGPPAPDLFWTLLLNNEPRNDARNPGPPDVSLPRAVPGHGLMGFETLYGDDNAPGDPYWRAHLVLDFLERSNPVHGGIPFLGFGDFSRRGNRDRPIGYLQPSSNGQPSLLSFQARLWDAIPPLPIGGGQPATLASYVWVLAEWGTKPKAIFVTLYHYNLQNSTPPANPAVNRFSWPFAQSVFYPGAEIVYIDAEDMKYYCGFETVSLALHEDVAYRIDLTRLFACADQRGLFTEPMPPDPDIPVTQVLWANESTGLQGAIWTDVHDPKMLGVPSISEASGATIVSKGARTAEIQLEIEHQCRAAPGCEQRAAILAAGRQADLELPLPEQPSRPELLQSVPVAGAPMPADL